MWYIYVFAYFLQSSLLVLSGLISLKKEETFMFVL